MTRDEFIASNPIEKVLEANGKYPSRRSGKELMYVCMFHKDRTPSLAVDVEKQLWTCHAGCGGGSVIDLIAKLRGETPADVLRGLGNGYKPGPPPVSIPQSKPASEPPANGVRPTIAKIYSYHDAFGKEAYQAVRLEPKSFRQRHRGPDDKWIWNMDGVERVLYRLPQVMASEQVAISEGEKDSETLTGLGFCGTCNVGGAGKWMDGYTAVLAGKDVLIFGDNDQPGKDHVEKVFESIAGKARSVRIVPVPNTFKDITEFVESFTAPDDAKKAIDDLIAETHPFIQGIKLPVYTMAEIEPRYEKLSRQPASESLDLSGWLPSLNRIRRLIPGELVSIVANTGVGKTALLSNIAYAAKPLPTIMFELELPPELLFERFVARASNLPCSEVEKTYAGGDALGRAALNHYFHHMLVCTEPGLTPEQIESMIIRSELKMGVRPKLVLIDYLQLAQSKGGSRYERASNVAEDLKIVAKSTRTIIIVASQVSRPADEDPEVGLHDAKGSGSIENSSGLMLGAWRDKDDPTLLWIKILKSTKGGAGIMIPCNFDGERMKITERTRLRV